MNISSLYFSAESTASNFNMFTLVQQVQSKPKAEGVERVKDSLQERSYD